MSSRGRLQVDRQAGLQADLHADLQAQVERVRNGALPRRRFMAQLAARGIAAPMASLLLLDAGIAQPAPATAWAPAKAGGGGPLKMLFWQGPTLLNPHFAGGTKDQEACCVFYEALARWDAQGELLPVLAAEIPSAANGGIARDGRSVTWKLKRGVTWHDGAPFTADDVVFNWQYATNPATAAFTLGVYEGLKVENMDTHTVRVIFDKPTPFWPGSFAAVRLIPRHLFAPYIGAKSRDAPNNLKPVGTGPFRFVEFRPGDLVRGERNPAYHQPNKPYFDSVEIKGGGDAVSAARAVLQTGEYDYGWDLLVEDDVLLRMEAGGKDGGGKGRVAVADGGSLECIYLNASDPNTEVDGERANPKSRHPLFSDPAVRQALGLLVDRASIQQFIYGRAGVATANYLNNPLRFRSKNTKAEFNIAKANALLDAAGWKLGSDGVRSKNGKPLKLLFQTSVNGPRQKVQTIIKQACMKAGIALELKSVTGSVFFSSDVANPDTYGKFWADVQMYTTSQGRPDPQRFMQGLISTEAASKANKWLGRNLCRWRNADYDRAYAAAESELDPVKRTALFIRMNDIACADGYVIPLVYRPDVAGLGRQMVAPLSGWDTHTSSLADWHKLPHKQG